MFGVLIRNQPNNVWLCLANVPSHKRQKPSCCVFWRAWCYCHAAKFNQLIAVAHSVSRDWARPYCTRIKYIRKFSRKANYSAPAHDIVFINARKNRMPAFVKSYRRINRTNAESQLERRDRNRTVPFLLEKRMHNLYAIAACVHKFMPNSSVNGTGDKAASPLPCALYIVVFSQAVCSAEELYPAFPLPIWPPKESQPALSIKPMVLRSRRPAFFAAHNPVVVPRLKAAHVLPPRITVPSTRTASPPGKAALAAINGIHRLNDSNPIFNDLLLPERVLSGFSPRLRYSSNWRPVFFVYGRCTLLTARTAPIRPAIVGLKFILLLFLATLRAPFHFHFSV